MATYLDIYNIAHDDNFRRRVQTAALLVSRDILNDGAEDQSGPRYVLARQALRLDEPVIDRFAWECALNPSINAQEASQNGSSPDGDIAFVVSSVWDAVAQ